MIQYCIIYGTVPSMGLQVLKQTCQTAGVVFNGYKIFTINKLWIVIAMYPVFTDGQKECLVSAICTCAKFSQKSGKPCYFGILPRNGHLRWQRRRVLISLGLTHNLQRRRIQWLEVMDKWSCGDCFTFYSVKMYWLKTISMVKSLCKIMEQWK